MAGECLVIEVRAIAKTSNSDEFCFEVKLFDRGETKPVLSIDSVRVHDSRSHDAIKELICLAVAESLGAMGLNGYHWDGPYWPDGHPLKEAVKR